MFFLKWILFPFSVLYDWVTAFRNHLFNIGYKRSFNFDTATISIGNLSVGGTGKTPVTEYLINLLKNQYKISTLSRGYGRKTRGFILAKEEASAKTIGDEPFQYYNKFKEQVVVAVGEDRAMAIPSILLEHPETDLILLDDAFQHRTVTPDYNILVSSFDQPFYKDFLLPTGMLRESRNGANRADLILLTKCPTNISKQTMAAMEVQIKKYNPKASIFFSSIAYQTPANFFGLNFDPEWSVCAVSGIAKPAPFISYLKEQYQLKSQKLFPDHHNFRIADIEAIEAAANTSDCILTTEKDYMRLLPWISEQKAFQSKPIFYIPINFSIINERNAFDQLILHAIKKKISTLNKEAH